MQRVQEENFLREPVQGSSRFASSAQRFQTFDKPRIMCILIVHQFRRHAIRSPTKAPEAPECSGPSIHSPIARASPFRLPPMRGAQLFACHCRMATTPGGRSAAAPARITDQGRLHSRHEFPSGSCWRKFLKTVVVGAAAQHSFIIIAVRAQLDALKANFRISS